MALRVFVDADGTEWQAWDVPPSRDYAQVRCGFDRRVQKTPDFHPERRVLRERRRLRTGTGLENGWICFQSEKEKRRFAPPPADWEKVAEDALLEMWRNAEPARYRL
jgi:hypothetical protein